MTLIVFCGLPALQGEFIALDTTGASISQSHYALAALLGKE
ncbi:MAG: hypothetical protein AAF412_04010 [Pseudomonadota bacterium]